MFNWSLIAGQSRGFTLMMQPVGSPAPRPRLDRAEPVAAIAASDDLVSALRFPLSPSWILQKTRRPLPSVLAPAAAPQPRGCG